MGKPKKGISDRVRKAKHSKAKNTFNIKSNPFEVKINKQKHNILGRKSKHDRGLPGVSRSKANKKRKDTLLKEYKDRHKANNVVDERFGEESGDITVEEKMLQRFAMEKKKKHEKLSMFNLNDEEELTHFGRSLADIDDFGADVISDDEDSGVISGDYVSEAHFGGGIFTKKSNSAEDSEEKRPKTKKEIMDEIILKSKKAKFERQNAQEESIALREKLDNTWKEVEILLKSSSRSKKDKEDAKDSYKPDTYDLAVKQMQYEKKAVPSERGKTEAEKAAEEAARLRKLEDERILRMHEYNDSRSKASHRSADELNDDFVAENILVEPVSYKDGVMVSSNGQDLGSENNDWQLDMGINVITEESSTNNLQNYENKDSEESSEGDDDEESDDFSDIMSASGEEDFNENSDEQVSDHDDDSGNVSLETQVDSHKNNNEKFPTSYEAFSYLLESEYKKDYRKCVEGLRNMYPPAAVAGNKDKMKTLFEFVWRLLYDLGIQEEPNMKHIDALISHLYKLCQLNLPHCAKFVVADFKKTYQKYLSSNGRISMPNFGHLLQFKLVKILFSTSDFSHPVCTPVMLFMSHVLQSCRPCDLRELSSGLFVCTLFYEYVCFSKRFVPECINFLCAAMCFSIPKEVQLAKGIASSASMHVTSKNCELLVVKDYGGHSKGVMEKPSLVKLLSGKVPEFVESDILRLQLQRLILRLVMKFIILYGNMPCFKETFDPIRITCTRCALGHRQRSSGNTEHPSANLLTEVQAEIQRMAQRKPSLVALVQVESDRPKALPLYQPRIEEVGEPFQKANRKKVSSAKRERERLQHKYKREMKGAVREIKKDARFIAREQINEQAEKDKERAAKVKRLFGLLSNQEGEVKKINRKKFKLELS